MKEVTAETSALNLQLPDETEELCYKNFLSQSLRIVVAERNIQFQM